MGQSTNGIIAFGVVCPEDFEAPWYTEEFDYDLESWWREVNGYAPTLRPFTEAGEYTEGWTVNDPRFTQHFAERKAWDEAHPLPVRDENYCSHDYPMLALVVPSSVKTAYRGDPIAFNPDWLRVDMHERHALGKFLDDYNIEYVGSFDWLLMSYWG